MNDINDETRDQLEQDIKESEADAAAEGADGDMAVVDALIAERDQWKDRALRAVAEAENVKRRAETQQNDARAYAIQRFAKDLLSVADTLPPRTLQHVDKYVLDNGQGGTGQRFDWSLLQGEKLDNVLLAGGLSPDNCVEAAKAGCAGLDFNSGVESQPGIKDASKLASVFKTLRAY